MVQQFHVVSTNSLKSISPESSSSKTLVSQAAWGGGKTDKNGDVAIEKDATRVSFTYGSVRTTLSENVLTVDAFCD